MSCLVMFVAVRRPQRVEVKLELLGSAMPFSAKVEDLTSPPQNPLVDQQHGDSLYGSVQQLCQ